MMWNDMSRQVRKLAAQTLGRTGRGRYVHDEILTRLNSSVASDRVEALKKINQIGIMTNKLIDPFLKCFRDDYISVRELACKASQSLNFETNDQKLIEALVFVARFDRIAKLKTLAIRSRFIETLQPKVLTLFPMQTFLSSWSRRRWMLSTTDPQLSFMGVAIRKRAPYPHRSMPFSRIGH